MDSDRGLPGGAVRVARRCAAAAEQIVRQQFTRVTVTSKGNRNVVTEADFAVERAVRTILGAEFPEHAILAEEESAGAWSDSWMWVCDPIDGTKNFSQGIPHFGFSIALCCEGRPVLGLTTQPLLGWEFLAVRGAGCRFNGDPVRVSDRGALHEAILAVDLGFAGDAGLAQLDLARTAWPSPQGVRIGGSATLGFAYVAAGKWDAYVHGDLSPWDVAAGIVLVEEAGGVVTTRDGSSLDIHAKTAIAGSPAVHGDVLLIARGGGPDDNQ